MRIFDLHHTMVGRGLAYPPTAPSPTAVRRSRRHIPGPPHLQINVQKQTLPVRPPAPHKISRVECQHSPSLIPRGQIPSTRCLAMTTQDRPPLCDGLMDDILHLRDLPERAYTTPDGARWVRKTPGTPQLHTVRTGPSLSLAIHPLPQDSVAEKNL